jgi:hypothetical protein
MDALNPDTNLKAARNEPLVALAKRITLLLCTSKDPLKVATKTKRPHSHLIKFSRKKLNPQKIISVVKW